MSTGSFADWAGSIGDIGPIYPFVGIEGFLVLAGVVFWVLWHIVQIRREQQRLKAEDKEFRSGKT